MNIEERFKALEEQVNTLKEQVSKLINQNDVKNEVDPINIKYWEYIGRSSGSFTNGKIYNIINGKDIYQYSPFMDDSGVKNGFHDNLRFFKPSTEEAYLAQQEPKNEFVHITTNEEYLFVISKFNPRGLSENLFERHKNICIHTIAQDTTYIGCWDFISDVDKRNTNILTFSEWCKKYNHEEPKYNQGFLVGDYSEKPLILEVSMTEDFNKSYFREISEVGKEVFWAVEGDDYWKFARKIDLDKYQI